MYVQDIVWCTTTSLHYNWSLLQSIGQKVCLELMTIKIKVNSRIVWVEINQYCHLNCRIGRIQLFATFYFMLALNVSVRNLFWLSALNIFRFHCLGYFFVIFFRIKVMEATLDRTWVAHILISKSTILNRWE